VAGWSVRHRKTAVFGWLLLVVALFALGQSLGSKSVPGGASSSDAVVNGIASSAGVITSAALIMVAVFSIFATMSFLDLKILGIGMASAVLIDATVVRGILLPAALALLGDRAWAVRAHAPAGPCGNSSRLAGTG
jgi:uncharacterized membrane protein YdfJ with MMPL/SSD domain